MTLQARCKVRVRQSGIRNIRLEIEYDGTNYCGWQVQTRNPAKKSVQQALETALRKIVHEKVALNASGRTDAGVHALAQVANFTTLSKIPVDKLQLALNSLLPDDIAVTAALEVGAGFHSRFSAKSKVYRYVIINRKYPSALLRDRAYFCSYPLDLALMRKEARSLLGRHNFSAFQASDKIKRAAVRTIKAIKIVKVGDEVRIEIEADGFLYNMVRNIAGTLLEAGRGRFERGSLKRILLSKNRESAGPALPAKGLFLVKVKY